ncbi:MAG TPA: phosphotransferase [Acidimicrobiia bacterium]|nr:phosphotransferase [Acidimicrobiia bacterium]
MIGTGSVVELAGPRGAAKTTVLPAVVDALRLRGLVPRTPVEAARDLAARGPVGSLAALLPTTLRGRVLWGIYVVEASALGWWRVLRRSGLRSVVRDQVKRPATAMVPERRMKSFIRHVGTDALFRRRARTAEVLVVADGYLHRAVQLFTSPSECASTAVVASYLTSIPPPALAVLVDAPPEVCVRRVAGRGVWPAFASRTEDEFAALVENASITTGAVFEVWAALGHRIVTVDNSGSSPGGAGVASALDSEKIVAAPRFRSVWTPPRAGTVRHQAVSLIRPRAIGAADVVAILAKFGLVRTGPVRKFSTGRRSSLVGVETDGGRVVMKRYPSYWEEQSILHEHAVLAKLEAIDFPAVRVVGAPQGETVVIHDGSAHALFRHVDGRTSTGRYLPKRMRDDLFTNLGWLLAQLHASLSGFDPGHQHHLGFERVTSLPRRSLSTYLELLASVDTHRTADDAARLRHWLDERRADIEDRLVSTHRRLEGHSLSTTIIHGDFGAHNVLYGDHGAVVLDFELARTEWRLREIALVLTRLESEPARTALLEAYRAGSDLGDEWKALGEVVQWYLLTGGLDAWEDYLTRSDTSRLAVAKTRIERALALESERIVTWS